MAQEDKELLFKDLSARLSYGVKATTTSNGWRDVYIVSGCNGNRIYLDCPVYDEGDDEWLIESVKPYLRPMSSMTEEEKEELKKLCEEDLSEFARFIRNGHGLSHDGLYMFDKLRQLEFCLSHHFDFRNLIEKGLAIEVTKENNPYKE